MSLLRNYQPDDRGLLQWVRDVRLLLTAEIGGIRHADNIGPLVSFRYNSTLAPMRVSIGRPQKPAGVYVMSALNRDEVDGVVQCGNRIAYQWADGAIKVTTIDDLSASTDYDVTLAVWMG